MFPDGYPLPAGGVAGPVDFRRARKATRAAVTEIQAVRWRNGVSAPRTVGIADTSAASGAAELAQGATFFRADPRTWVRVSAQTLSCHTSEQLRLPRFLICSTGERTIVPRRRPRSFPDADPGSFPAPTPIFLRRRPRIFPGTDPDLFPAPTPDLPGTDPDLFPAPTADLPGADPNLSPAATPDLPGADPDLFPAPTPISLDLHPDIGRPPARRHAITR